MNPSGPARFVSSADVATDAYPAAERRRRATLPFFDGRSLLLLAFDCPTAIGCSSPQTRIHRAQLTCVSCRAQFRRGRPSASDRGVTN